jgi:hypothetical protein
MGKTVVNRLKKIPDYNVQVTYSQSPKNARSESAIAVNPQDSLNMIGASKRFTDPAIYAFTLAAYATIDGGKSWAEAPPLQLPPGSENLSDPVAIWDNIGNAFIFGLPVGPAPANPYQGLAVYRSSDKGFTWGAPLLIHSSTGDDKPWAAGDVNPASPYCGNLYAAWDDGSFMGFARSLDHGATWKGIMIAGEDQPAGTHLPGIPDSFSPEISVATDGTVYIVWIAGSRIKYVKSIDSGASFSPPMVAADGIGTIQSLLPHTDGWPHFPGGTFRVLTLPTGCAGSGKNVIFAWADVRSGLSRIYYRHSHNGGETWGGPPNGQPLLIGALDSPSYLHMQHFFPQLISMPDGTIGCAFYEFGQKGSAGRNLIDVLLAVSFNDGDEFTERITVTDSPWDPTLDAPLAHGDPNVTFIGDYFGLDVSSLGFFPFWTDTRTGIQEIFTSRVTNEQFVIIDEKSAVKILFGVTQDGGGIVVTPDGKGIRIPPRPGPFQDIVTGLAIHEMATSVESDEGRAMQRMAMDMVGKLAQQEIRRLDVNREQAYHSGSSANDDFTST